MYFVYSSSIFASGSPVTVIHFNGNSFSFYAVMSIIRILLYSLALTIHFYLNQFCDNAGKIHFYKKSQPGILYYPIELANINYNLQSFSSPHIEISPGFAV